MLQTYGTDFVELSQLVEELWHYADENYRMGDWEKQTDYVAGQLHLAWDLADHMPFPSVRAQIRRIQDLMSDEEYGIITLFNHLKELRHRLEDDAETIQFLHIPAERTRYYAEGQPFGEQVATKFPSAIDDIGDAGKCLAVGQGTATVFHLMRVMEAGLKSLGRSLGIAYAPSWESYLKQINALIAADHKSKSDEWKKDEPFYRDLAGDLQIVKISWRNPTMHIVKKYTPEEAEEIYRAVRSFMRRLAIGLAE